MRDAKTLFLLTALAMMSTAAGAFDANTIDWRTGRPGVRVVTNAPSPTQLAAVTNTATGGARFGAVKSDSFTLGEVTITEWPTGVGVTETDPIAGPRLVLLEGRTNSWNAAFGWGNHALAGYLTEYVETDPITGPRLILLEGRTNDWNSAVSWGNHALAGYLTEYTDVDTLASVAARGGFAGTETIRPLGIMSQHGGFGWAVTNTYSIGDISGGDLTCNPSSGDMNSNSAQYFKVYAFKYVPDDPLERMVFSATALSKSFLPIGTTKPYSYTLKWGPVSGADGYKIYVPGGPYFSQKVKFLTAATTNLTITTATTGFYDGTDTQPEISPFTVVTTNMVSVIDAFGLSYFTGSILLSRVGTPTANDVLTKAEIESLPMHSIFSTDETLRIDGDANVWQMSGTLKVTGSGASYNGPATGSFLYFDGDYYDETGEIYYTNTVWSLYLSQEPMIHWYMNKIDAPEWGAFIADSFLIPTSVLSNNTDFALGSVTLSYESVGNVYYRTDRLGFESQLSRYPTIEYHSAAMAAAEVKSTNDIAIAVSEITPALIGALALSDAPGLTNGLGQSTLISYLTNATGSVTQQVWQTGAAVCTNFFSGAAVETFTNGWIRPSYWPVASGYTPETWIAPEVGKIKMLIIPDPEKPTVMNCSATGTTNTWAMDWFGDGTIVSNYTCNTNIFFKYPAQYANRLVPAIATWNGNTMGLVMYMNTSANPPPTVLRTNSCVIIEAVMSGTNSAGKGFGMVYQYAPELKAVYCYNQTIAAGTGTAGSGFGDCIGLQYVRLDNCGFTGSYGFMRCYGLQIVDVFNSGGGTMGQGQFNTCVSMRSFSGRYRTTGPTSGVFWGANLFHIDLPDMTNLVTNFALQNYRLEKLTPMPGLLTVGTSVFKQCNLDFNALTNFVLSLTNDVSAAPQTIDFSLNRGSAEFGTWLTGGGSALVAPGWSFIY